MTKGYVLRFAAGKYWLVRPLQNGKYEPPRQVNESGVWIWDKLEKGQSVGEIASDLAIKEGIPYPEAKADVEAFLQQLDTLGME